MDIDLGGSICFL